MNNYFTAWINGEWCEECYYSLEEAKSALEKLLSNSYYNKIGENNCYCFKM